MFTPSGRTVAATAGAPGVAAREAVALVADGTGETVSVEAGSASPYDRWLLCVPDPDSAPPRMLQETAAALSHCQEAAARRRSAERRAADGLGALHSGTGAPADGPEGLGGAPAQARYALTSARTTAPDASLLADATALTSLDALLTGVPAEVRAAYGRTVLGPLLESDRTATAVLLSTLETFLACDGSWARTVKALHLHVNTVHYRMQRIEHFTGRDLSLLSDRLDLWAALLCR
ncbi:PucR family transcriptional regulator [Streptomyces sp. PTD9-10]|uniref:PucR family transcriptional regulator n=1 Tax=Streptomyces sp. PTD9-10 TaxID=3120151 RepID=UPI003009BB23